jgi:NAD(P)-dependent dehydrogenase (short-subunit alcohol dehydrogenase family)
MLLITGVAGGIGRATAAAALEAGVRVTGVDLRDPGIPGVEFVAADVAERAAWQVLATLGPYDRVFLNAGIMAAPGGSPAAAYAIENVDDARYRRLLGANVDGVVFALQALVPRLAPGASVLVTASLAGLYRYEFDPLYAMTKHAVVGLVKSLAPVLEARGIRLNALCPGAVETDLLPVARREDRVLAAGTVARVALDVLEERASGRCWVLPAGATRARMFERRRRWWQHLGRR